MASMYPPKKNTAFTLCFTLYKNDGTVIANPGTLTRAVSVDGGGVDTTPVNAVTEEDTTYGQLSWVLDAAEMNGDWIWVYCKDDTSGCVPFTCTLYTSAQTLDEVKTDTAAILADTGTDGVLLSSGIGAKQISLSSGEVTPTAASKTGYALAATGADLILKSSTFIQAVAAAVSELATTGLAALKTLIDTLTTRLGTPSDLGSGASVAGNLVDIEGQTDDIGAAGAGLTALGDTRIANLDATISSRHASGAAVAKSPATLAAADVTGNLPADLKAITAGVDLSATMKTSVADAVLDAPIADHLDAGTVGELVQDIDDEVDYIHSVVDSIAVTGAALAKEAASRTIATNKGTETSGTYESTAIDNGVYHIITAQNNEVDIYYEFQIGASGVPTKVNIAGYLKEGAPAGQDTIDLYAYNWGVGWELLQTAIFTGITGDGPDVNHAVGLLNRHVGTGADDGKVRIRFQAASLEAGTTLNLDYLVVEFAESIAADVTTILGRQRTTNPVTGVVATDGGNSATSFKVTITGANANDFWKYAGLRFTSGALAGQIRRVTGYTHSSTTITCDAFTATPADGVSFELVN
jgi:hypothetical protein